MSAAGLESRLTASQGLAYGLMGLPLAFVALPLYVVLPHYYASEFGVPLASLGFLLLTVRAADAVADPLIGLGVDRLLGQPWRTRMLAAVLAAAGLALAFQALFFPAVRSQSALLAWCGAALAVCYVAYSGLSVLHQAWGARLGGDASQRARIVSWREGAALVGVIVASVLPGTLGVQAASLALAAALTAGLLGWAAAPPPPRAHSITPPSHPWAPWLEPRFRRLLGIYLLNGVASALPATLVLFFIRDRLQWPEGEPLLLGLYFAAAALSLPIWVRVVARIGLAQGWALGMALSILAFVGAVALGAGDGLWFAAVCVASGAALGADLCVPPALLAGLLRDSPVQDEGVAFGWWNAATKLNLAMAAGLALPLLQALGYQPGRTDDSSGLALSLVYAALPCALKALALLALWRQWIRKEHPR